MFIGWDWASHTHDVTVVDPAGTIVGHWAFAHSEAALQRIFNELAKLGAPYALPVAIERPSGLVVERLLAAGHPVVPVHPNAFNATRPRWGASRAKSDPGESYRLADLLRTDGHRLRRLKHVDLATRNLQAICRSRDDHIEARIAATNQLQALLDGHWPGAAAIFFRLDSDIALEFLDRYPTPDAVSRLGEQRLGAFMRRFSYCGRRSPAELLARLQGAPLAPLRLDHNVLAELVHAQVRILRGLLATITDFDRAISAAVMVHPKAHLFARLPRVAPGLHRHWSGSGTGCCGRGQFPLARPTSRSGVAS
jgi:Transposase